MRIYDCIYLRKDQEKREEFLSNILCSADSQVHAIRDASCNYGNRNEVPIWSNQWFKIVEEVLDIVDEHGNTIHCQMSSIWNEISYREYF